MVNARRARGSDEHAAISAEMVAVTTLDYSPSGELTSASVTTTASADGDGWVGLAPGSVPGAPTELSGQLGYAANEGGRLEVTYTLPVHDDADRAALTGLLTDDPLGGGVGSFIDLVGTNGEVLVQAYTSTASSDMADAFSYDPAHGFQRRRDCVG